MAEIGYWASQEQYSMQQLIDFVKKAEKGGFESTLTSDHFHPWSHTNGHGQRRPFSYAVLKTVQKTPDDGGKEIQTGQEVFVVREQLFKHNGKFYMLASHPEGKSWTDYVNSSTRYVSRLDSFPYSNLSDIDHEHYKLRHKIKRFRGTPVGEATGLGQDEGGHRLRLDNELADIGLFIAAISYLLYASG